MAKIFNYQTGEQITAGLQGCTICDEAIQAARRISAEREKPVLLQDDDGEWIVHTNGSCEEHRADAYDAAQE